MCFLLSTTVINIEIKIFIAYMEQKYVILDKSSLPWYMLDLSYLSFLNDDNIIKLYELSANNEDLQIYKYLQNNDTYKKLNASEIFYKSIKKYKYVQYEDFQIIKDNYYIEHNNVVIKITNMFKNKCTHNIRRFIYVIRHSRCKDTYKYVLDYIIDNNMNTLKLENFLHLHKIISHNINWFVIGSSKCINYNNIEHLKNIQNNLINDETYRIKDNSSSSSLNIDWWTLRGWNEEQAKQNISAIQSKNAIKCKDKRQKNPDLYASSYSNRIEYWIKLGYSYDEAEKKLKDRQSTFTLEKCIKRYGVEEGKKKFEDRQKKWQNTLQSKDDYIDIVIKRCSHSFFSNISQELFDKIYQLMLENNIKCDVYYHNLNHEWGFGIKKHGGVLYDFVIPSLKYAIEFNGSRFHPNKDKLSKKDFKNWVNPWGVSGKQQYKYDMFKNNAIIKRGYTLDIIWDDEYNKNKNEVVNKIITKIIDIYKNETNKSNCSNR